MWAGVDGCRAGWVLALGERTPEIQLHTSFAEVLKATQKCRGVAVDMPIGLPPRGVARACDREARLRLGPRRSSVFPAPPREALEVADYSELRKWGMSIQTFHLLPKIAELDSLLNPSWQARIYECHPELVWTRLAGLPMSESKKTLEGQRQRCKLLPFQVPGWDYPKKWVAADDVIDALGLWLAASQEQAQWRLPVGLEERDQRGLRMEIRA